MPKCLVPVGGKPVLGIWLDLCQELGLREVLINTHHLADQVEAWAASQADNPVRIRLVYERELLGSAGTIVANWNFVEGEEDFFIFYADNLVHMDFNGMLGFHQSHTGLLTVALFHSSHPWNCGIALLDEHNRITGFEEKPACPKSDLANGGIYIARRGIHQFLPTPGYADFAIDVFPRLIGEMRGFVIDGRILDVGTPENYDQALREWPAINREAARKE
jgi:mannose-1-phosphate guanylyltransferase